MLEVEIAVTQSSVQGVVPFEVVFEVMGLIVDDSKPVDGILSSCCPVGVGALSEIETDVAFVAPLTLEADTSYIIYEYKQLEEVAKPYFSNGDNIGQYIAKNIQVPAEAKEREIQGTVRLSFVVETDGSVSNIVVVNSVGGGCDNEAVRLLQNTIWIPAEKNGKYVRSTNMQDITFNIGAHNFQDGNSY